MKKRILSFTLSLFLLGAAAVGTAACHDGGNGGNYQPGTVITDETVRGSLLDGIAQAQTEGISFSAGLGITLTAGEETMKQEIALEGAARLSDGVEADVFARARMESGEERALQSLLCFVRKEATYSVSVEQEDEETSFSALKEQLKGEDPIVLEKGEAASPLYTAPAAGKMLKNLAALLGGVAVKTEGGYTLTFDLVKGLGGLIDGAAELLGSLEQNAEMTVTALFSQPFISGTLPKLFNGITAKELYETLKLLPEDVLALFPAAEGGSAEDYIKGLLRSGSFYEKATNKEGVFAEYKTFGEVPVKKLLDEIGGTEFLQELTPFVTGLRTNLGHALVSLLLPVFSLEGDAQNENIALSAQFSFDNEKKLIGLSLDALAEGDIVQGERQPDGGTEEEDGGGDEMALLAGEAEGAEEQKQRLSVSLKLAAAFTESPELFDLKGCKYRSGDGEQTISA